MDAQKRLKDWNESLDGLSALASKMRRDAIRSRGIRRRVTMALLRWTERWIERGRRWRNEDMGE
jgi:hypothetical protein